MKTAATLAGLGLLLGGDLACSAPPAEATIDIGLMLSYSGYLAANSINSERALIMAIDAANTAGGVDGRRVRLLARDTRSDPAKVSVPARELLDAGVAVFMGPDTTDLATQLRTLLRDRTMILPALATASDVEFKSADWFVMGASIARVACELVAQLKADGRTNPLLVVNPTGYNSSLSWELTNKHGMRRDVLPTDQSSTTSTVRPITSVSADGFVLAALPTSASSLVYALAAVGALHDPGRWYLSPTLHNPAFLESIPKGTLKGARGVSPGTVAGAGDFRTRFKGRWQDEPLDDAYPFYDAGAVTVLALQRAIARTGSIPTGTGLSRHIRAVTNPSGGTAVSWNELDKALGILRDGQEVEYLGLSGPLAFDASGQTPDSSTRWWTIGDDGFEDISNVSTCR